MEERLDPVAALRLPPTPRAPRLAREYAERFLRERHHPELAERASLVVSELVTNAVVHAGGDGCRLQLHLLEPPVRLRIEVHDGDRDARVEPTEQGSGLRLVGDNASAWGIERGDESKLVWAELSG